MSDSAYRLPLGLLSPTYRAKSAFMGVPPKGVPEGKNGRGPRLRRLVPNRRSPTGDKRGGARKRDGVNPVLHVSA